ncbi:hypothetical protein HMPREF0762_02009 [Slackia exigua ATCC 700122]|uniref:Uncharacterized protein n=1 Tax=Slackia exigua (strain ATCC 700122 / DSM 15923 / CIP 105133 / JCM 11022 / KCTC 5966 / S-7) TaxID=649764 RepID=D0WJI1_SLAES|nr:hypothetical protein HMPREF0762_02009 [Slackia exigua ATCC 700122]
MRFDHERSSFRIRASILSKRLKTEHSSMFSIVPVATLHLYPL